MMRNLLISITIGTNNAQDMATIEVELGKQITWPPKIVSSVLSSRNFPASAYNFRLSVFEVMSSRTSPNDCRNFANCRMRIDV